MHYIQYIRVLGCRTQDSIRTKAPAPACRLSSWGEGLQKWHLNASAAELGS